MTDLYTPTEQAILCDYFKIPRPTGCQLTMDDDIVDGVGHDVAMRNAVARIALSVIQNRLPQCGVFDGEGGLTLTRGRFPRPPRDVVTLPQHLFMINWADTAPGISWPEVYHATYIPGYARYVVTASFDGTDMHGVTELAIGFFDGDRQPVDGSADVIKEWWRYLMSESCQDRWAYVWDEGLIDSGVANSCADEVWAEETDDDEEED